MVFWFIDIKLGLLGLNHVPDLASGPILALIHAHGRLEISDFASFLLFFPDGVPFDLVLLDRKSSPRRLLLVLVGSRLLC